MFRNYLLLAFRTHLKSKLYTVINIVGLSVGIAACLIIVVFLQQETSYDAFNEKSERIYRVNTELAFGSVHKRLALAAPVLPELFLQNYPEIESSTRLMSWGPQYVKRPDRAGRIKEKTVWADSTLFNTFTFSLIEGDAHTALSAPNTIAVSRTLAERYFPEGDVLGKLLEIGDNDSYKITAVFEDLPPNCHFHFDIFRSLVQMPEMKNVSLIGGGWTNTYFLLHEGADPRALESKFPQFIAKYVAPQISDIFQGNFTMEKFKADGNSWSYWLTPLTDIHLRSDLEGELEANGNITYVYLFGAVAAFILAVACINFMNLSTAQSTNRAREVGIRKVMGSNRAHLLRQFLMESFVLSFVSFLLALLLAWFLEPVFNDLAQKNISIPFQSAFFYIWMAGGVVAVGFLAGIYPSFFLSSFKPVDTLKGKLVMGTRTGFVRSSLVVFQFVISISLIIGTIAIQKQLYYVQNKKIGFNREQVIVIHEAHALSNHVQAFKEEALKSPAIIAGTVSSYLPVANTWRNNNTYWPEGQMPTGQDLDQMVAMQGWQVDHDYLTTLGMKMKAGRYFSRDIISDSTDAVILNESAVNQFQLGPDPVGKKVSSFTANNPDGSVDLKSVKSWTVIGVIEDFHFANMRDNIAPLGLFLKHSSAYVSFRFQSGKTKEVLEALENTWDKFAGGNTFQYSYLDDDYGKMYENEKRLGQIFAVFAGLAIIIACLGLFALAAFTAEQRTKEIGIRKSLGASVSSIIFLLSRTYGRLVIIAFVVSTPIAWYGIDLWIREYSYRANIGVEVYAFAGIIALLVALATIVYQCLRAARRNPVLSLRSE